MRPAKSGKIGQNILTTGAIERPNISCPSVCNKLPGFVVHPGCPWNGAVPSGLLAFAIAAMPGNAWVMRS